MSDVSNEHDPQPVKVTDGEEVCGSVCGAEIPFTDGVQVCTYPPGHGPLVTPDGKRWSHGVKDENMLWLDEPDLRALAQSMGFLEPPPPDALNIPLPDPPPPGLADRSLEAAHDEAHAVLPADLLPILRAERDEARADRDGVAADADRLRDALTGVVNTLGPLSICTCAVDRCGLHDEAAEALRVAREALGMTP